MNPLKFTSLIILALLSNTLVAQEGELDISFSGDGILAINSFFGYSATEARSSVGTPDHKIYIAGQGHNGATNNDLILLRVLDDGTPDTTFNETGYTTYNYGGYAYEEVTSVCLQDDGKIIVAGSTYYEDSELDEILFVRFNPDGTIDESFGDAGVVIMDLSSENDIIADMLIDETGRIIAIASIGPNSNSYAAIMRLLDDGSFDDTFGTDGITITEIGTEYTFPLSLVVQPDGKYVVGGNENNGDENDVLVMRYLNNGTLDDSFGIDGVATNEISGSQTIRSIALQSDGKIVGAYIANNYSISAIRFDTDGNLDATFGDAGAIVVDYSGLGNVFGPDLIVQPDDKIVICSALSDFLNVSRLLPDGDFDTDFAFGGTYLDNLMLSLPYPTDIILQPDGKILVTGDFAYIGSGSDFMVLRFISGLDITSTDLQSNDESLLIYPNPVGESAIINFQLIEDEQLHIILKDINGNQIQDFGYCNFSKGETEKLLNFNTSIAAGIYFLSFENVISSVNVKIVKL
ncbi:MAG: T9SS type A sorting domain-containing protein [Chitinophagales bacterium]